MYIKDFAREVSRSTQQEMRDAMLSAVDDVKCEFFGKGAYCLIKSIKSTP